MKDEASIWQQLDDVTIWVNAKKKILTVTLGVTKFILLNFGYFLRKASGI